jgi:microcystin-dependent protein
MAQQLSKRIITLFFLIITSVSLAQVELVSAGTGAAYTLAYPANTSGYVNGMSVTFKAHIANTGTCTININSHGPKNIVNTAGSALSVSDIRLDQVVTLVYDGTNFQMVTTSGNTGGGSGVLGSGTLNFVSKWSATAAISNSVLYDNGTNVGIGTTVPNTTLDIRTKDAVVIPAGTTAQRPSTVTAGGLRYNSDIGCVEYYDGSGWNSLVPPGTIVAYGGVTAPSGWLLCDGSTINRVTYAKLFIAIGVAWGNGDGVTTFHLPDARGRFLRGVNSGSGNDPDVGTRAASNTGGNTADNVGSKQTDAFASHNHSMPAISVVTPGAGSSFQSGVNSGNPIILPVTNSTGTSTETRPKNVNVNYIIKY